VAIEQFDKANLPGKSKKSDDVAKSSDIDGLGLHVLPMLGGASNEIGGGAQIDRADDLRFAVDSLTFAGVIVSSAVYDLGSEACHEDSFPVSL